MSTIMFNAINIPMIYIYCQLSWTKIEVLQRIFMVRRPPSIVHSGDKPVQRRLAGSDLQCIFLMKYEWQTFS